VDKVTFEPSLDHPERIRISGAFITARETHDDSTVYKAPQRGYLYFGLPLANMVWPGSAWLVQHTEELHPPSRDNGVTRFPAKGALAFLEIRPD